MAQQLNKKVSFSGSDDGLFALLEKAKSEVNKVNQASAQSSEKSFKSVFDYSDRLKTLLDDLKKTSGQYYDLAITGAKNYSDSGKRQLDFIKLQTEAIEKQSGLLKQKRLEDMNATEKEYALKANQELKKKSETGTYTDEQKDEMKTTAHKSIEQFKETSKQELEKKFTIPQTFSDEEKKQLTKEKETDVKKFKETTHQELQKKFETGKFSVKEKEAIQVAARQNIKQYTAVSDKKLEKQIATGRQFTEEEKVSLTKQADTEVKKYEETVNKDLQKNLDKGIPPPEERIKMSHDTKKDIERFNAEQLKSFKKQEETDKKSVELLKEILETIKISGAQTISNNRQTLDKSIIETQEKVNKKEDVSDQELLLLAQKKDFQKQFEKDEKPASKSIAGDVFKGALGANIVTEVAKGVIGSVKQLSTHVSEAKSGTEFFQDAISQVNILGIPIGAFFGGLMKRATEEQFKVETAQQRFYGKTNRGRGFNKDEATKDFENAAEFGFASEEMYGYAEQASTARGTRKNIKHETVGAAAVERAFSIDRSTIMSLFKDMGVSSSKMDVGQNVALMQKMVPGIKSGDDTSVRLEGFLQLQSSIMQQQSQVMEKISTSDVINNLGNFAKIDSEFFKDPRRLSPIVQSINQSLQQPQNEFAQARNMMVLSKLQPNASYFDMIKMQSHGLMESGFLQKSLEMIQRLHPTSESQKIAVTGKSFGGGGLLGELAPDVAESLIDYFKKNPTAFEGFKGSEADLKKMMSTTGIEGLAIDRTPSLQKERVKVSEQFVKGGSEGAKEIMKQSLQSAVDKIKDAKFNIPTPLGDVDVSKTLVDVIEKIGSSYGVKLKDPYGREKNQDTRSEFTKRETESETKALYKAAGVDDPNAAMVKGFEMWQKNMNGSAESVKKVGDNFDTLNNTIDTLNTNLGKLNNNATLVPAEE